MIFDPLYEFLRTNFNLDWWIFWLIYALLFITVVITILFLSGGKSRVKEYFKDTLGSFLWPFFVLGPITGSYIRIAQLGVQIDLEFTNIGLKYADFQQIKFQNTHYLFWIILAFAVIMGLEGQIRYKKYQPTLWLSKPKILHPLLMVLFNVPLSIMGVGTILRLLDQWIVMHNFMVSGWLPSTPFSIDQMYGMKWLYNIIVVQISLATLASFGSIFMLVREGKKVYSWIYKALFFVCVIIIGGSLFVLTQDMNLFLSNIFSNSYRIYSTLMDESIIYIPQTNDIDLLRQLILETKIAKLNELPQSIPLPPWLSSLLGLRVLVFIPEIYQIVAKKTGWKSIPTKMIKFIKEVT